MHCIVLYCNFIRSITMFWFFSREMLLNLTNLGRQNIYRNCSYMKQFNFLSVICPKDTNGMAKSVYPDLTAPMGVVRSGSALSFYPST